MRHLFLCKLFILEKKFTLDAIREVRQKNLKKKFLFKIPWNGEKIEEKKWGGGQKNFQKKFVLRNPLEWREN